MTKSVETEYESFEASSPERRRHLRQEELILEVTEALAKALKESGVTQAEIARRLGRSKGFVSQVLAGGRNLTLRTLADFADALECRPVVELLPEARVVFETALTNLEQELTVHVARAQPLGAPAIQWARAEKPADKFNMTNLIVASAGERRRRSRQVA